MPLSLLSCAGAAVDNRINKLIRKAISVLGMELGLFGGGVREEDAAQTAVLS